MSEPNSSPETPTQLPTHAVAQDAKPDGTGKQDWRPVPQRYGRFAVQRFHARGGLGEVHVAFDEELKRDVALKRIQDRYAGDAASHRRFLTEAEITARLEHPGIVPIYGLVQDEHGQPCYAMRFIEGESLAAAIKRFHAPKAEAQRGNDTDRLAALRPPGAADYATLPFRQLLQRLISVCQTMAYAHSKQVIHRDLKPANIMLGPFGETLVVDWGLARELASRDRTEAVEAAKEEILPSTVQFTPSGSDDRLYTQAGRALGSPAYMAPEQAAGRWSVVGPCSDIYSLGATLYELLTGKRAVEGTDVYESLQKVQAGDFPTPRQVQAAIPKPLEAICLKAMARSPDARYATAKGLAADLEHWLADEPVIAWPEPWTVRYRRWARRHRTLVSSAIVALLLGVAALAGITVLREQHAAEVERQRNELAERNIALEEARQSEQYFAELGQRTVEAMTDENAFAALRTARGLTEAQKKWLGRAVNYYAEVTARAATDQAARARQLKAYGRMAFLQQEFGENAAAEQSNRRGLELAQKLAADYPDVPQYRVTSPRHTSI